MNAQRPPESAHSAPTQTPQHPSAPTIAVQFLRPQRKLEFGHRPKAKSALEEQFAFHLRTAQLPAPQREYRFDPVRRWKFDFAWPTLKIAVECEGGIWTHGRHTRAAGFEADCLKYNAATLQGWRVLRFTSKMIQSGTAVDTLAQALRRAA